MCLWQQRTPSFGNIWTSSFLKSPKRLISNCSWTWSSLTLAGKGWSDQLWQMSNCKWRKLALNSFSEKFNVELLLSVVQSSETEAKYWWRFKGQLPREGKHLAGLNLAKWCDWSVFVSLIDRDWSIFVSLIGRDWSIFISLYRKFEAFVSSCSMQTEKKLAKFGRHTGWAHFNKVHKGCLIFNLTLVYTAWLIKVIERSLFIL